MLPTGQPKLCVAVALLCTACTSLVPTREASPEGEIPARFSLGDAAGEQVHRWWEDFDRPELACLVDEAMRENLTLRQLWARLDQARSVTVQAASGLYPQFDYTGDVGYTRTETNLEIDRPSFRRQLRNAALTGAARGLSNAIQGTSDGSGASGGSSLGSVASSADDVETRIVTETRRFGFGLGAAYELDIWGRIYTQYRAAQSQEQATRDELEAAAITLAAEITDRWLRILEQQALHKLLDEQLETNQTYLELVELRFRKGLVSALDVYQQRQTVSEVRRQIPLVEAAEQLFRQDLAVLLGKPPTASIDIGVYDLQTVPPLPPTGVPAELLVHRPDIRAVVARLSAAEFEVGSARAELFPAIRLAGGIGTNTTEIRNLFNDWYVSTAAAIAGPLFDGFRRTAEVERSRAVVEQRLAEVRLTVLSAIQEVESALVQEVKQREYIEALVEQLGVTRNALREASQRYRKGLTDYLPVLAALERTQSLARILVVARRELLTFRTNLYRALGGTWTGDLARPVVTGTQPARQASTIENPKGRAS